MKKNIRQTIGILFFMVIICAIGFAGNPIISHNYTADPTAHIGSDGRVWLYPSHDVDGVDWCSGNYIVYSSYNMVNWTDHGECFNTTDVSWNNNADLYAAGTIERNGITYLYWPNTGSNIGVATSSSPSGRFVDARGSALVTSSTPGVSGCDWVFDPAAYIDDDGQAYLYFGGSENADRRVINLNSDMISVSGSASSMSGVSSYFEGPWMHKRNGTYYYSYAGNGATQYYGMGSNATGPWTYKGSFLPPPGSANSHHAIIEYYGQWYVFYHNKALSGNDKQRSTNIDYLYYNGDGSMQTVTLTTAGVSPVQTGPTPTPGPPTPTPPPATPTPTPGQNVLMVEAESASGQSNFSPFAVQSSSSASGGQYIVWPNNGSNQINTTASDSATGQAAYTFTLSQTANVTFKATVNFANGNDDSFHYKMDSGSWSTQNNTSTSGFQELSIATFNNLSSGTHTLTIERREDGAQIDLITLTASGGTITGGSGGPTPTPPPATPTPTPPPATPTPEPGSLVQEAEDATITSPMQIQNDSNASGGQYITVATGNNSYDSAPSNGRAVFTFNVTQAGTYRINGLVIAPDYDGDSFWVQMDSSSFVKWNGLAVKSSWTWDEVHNSDSGDSIMEYNLSTGNHTVTFAYREDHAKLDKIELVLQ